MDLNNYNCVKTITKDKGEKKIKSTKKRIISVLITIIFCAYTILSKFVLGKVNVDLDKLYTSVTKSETISIMNTASNILTYIVIGAVIFKVILSIIEASIKNSLFTLNHSITFNVLHYFKNITSLIMLLYCLYNYLLVIYTYSNTNPDKYNFKNVF